MIRLPLKVIRLVARSDNIKTPQQRQTHTMRQEMLHTITHHTGWTRHGKPHTVWTVVQGSEGQAALGLLAYLGLCQKKGSGAGSNWPPCSRGRPPTRAVAQSVSVCVWFGCVEG